MLEKKQIIFYLYKGRQERILHPLGHFNSDRKWFPDDKEKCKCCEDIKTPSRGYPFTLNQHCRTKKHVKEMVEKLWKSENEYLQKEAEYALKEITYKNLGINRDATS